MGNFTIECRPKSEDEPNNLYINVVDKPEEKLLYKFIIGFNGTWNTIKDFAADTYADWMPDKNGMFIIMVQAKKETSTRPFDHVTRMDYIAGIKNLKLIDSLNVQNSGCYVGERVIINCNSKESGLLYRFLSKSGSEWKLIKDYSLHNMVEWSTRTSGTKDIIAECKKIDSIEDFDDFAEVKFEVLQIRKPVITSFKCITSEDEILIDVPVVFETEVFSEEGRNILYSFIKKDEGGSIRVIQDYSSNSFVCSTETEPGEYSLLCLIKDMYSQNAFDDKKTISYIVKPYRDIKILNFSANVNSPQSNGTPIMLTADAKGGNELIYRFLIDGNENQDSGYSRNNSFKWVCNTPGNYKLMLYVKDVSCDKPYEKMASIDYEIDDKSKEPVKINEVLLNKEKRMLINETVNIKINALGGIALRYSFIVKKDENLVEKIDYGTCDWVNFTPESSGHYEIEIRVKDKFSQREYDSHKIISMDAVEYIPAKIEYILLPSNKYFLVQDEISAAVVLEKGSSNLLKYTLKINGRKVEETGFTNSLKYTIKPKCSGLYTLEVIAKNKGSNKLYDSMESINLIINDTLPITNAKITSDKFPIKACEAVCFTVSADGGNDVLYEFHLMALNEWNIVQKYSRKSYFSFIPYNKGHYKILSLLKSSNNKCSYEDYDIMEFDVD